MKVVQVWSKTKPVNSTLDVFVYVGGRVGDLPIPEGGHSAFRGHYRCY